MHLAQLNIGKPLGPMDGPVMRDFKNGLDLVNGIAERSPGFVWRLKDENNNATAIRAFDDPDLLINLSVWQDAESLEQFVWQTVHKRFYARKGEWFEKSALPHFAMWWVEPGHRPSLLEARERIEHLHKHGPSEHVFGWESLPNIRLWMSARCA
jgi:Domain of unknown function (DUF3291)